MNKKALLVLSIGLLSMTLAACGNKPINSSIEKSSIDYGPSQTCSGMTTPPSSSLEPSSEITFSSVVSSSDISVPSSSAAPSSSVAPVSSSEAPSSSLAPSSSSTPISSSEATISSSEAPSSSENPDAPRDVVVNLPSYTDSSKTYDLTFRVDKDDFEYSADSFSKKLAMFGFGASIANQNKAMMNKFFTDGGFDHIYFSDTYDVAPTEDTIAYSFAHLPRMYSECQIIVVSIRGFNYGQEWKDNFNLGKEDEHAGFAAKADLVHSALEQYLVDNGYYKVRGVNLFITGYSRGGAVANLLAKRINEDFYDINKPSIYDAFRCYTFEAPKGAVEELSSCQNTFNIVSSGDLITYFAPEQYGFGRYGKDVDIYKANIDEIVSAFDSELILPTLSTEMGEYYTDDVSLINYIINYIVSYEGDPDDDTASKPARTREEFVDNYQESVGYLVGIFFGLKSETTAAIKEAYGQLSVWQMLGLMSEDGLYNFLKPFVEADGISYDDALFRTHCNMFPKFAAGPGAGILSAMMQDSNALSRIIMLHTPEVNYALLNAFQIEE